MRTALVLLATLAIFATAAPPAKKTGKSSDDKQAKTFEKEFAKPNSANETDDGQNYCYDSTWSFKCRHTSPNQYELECKIINVDGDPCFPDLETMIEASAPLATISYPVQSYEAYEIASNVDATATIVTAENIEWISLQAPFEQIPADAFASLPQLKQITLESLDGVKNVAINKHAFRNTTAKQLHLIGHNVHQILAQQVDLQNFHTVSFTDIEIECHHQASDQPQTWSSHNASCENVFANLQHVETLNLESIYVKGDSLDERVFHPLKDNLKKLTVDVVFKTPRQQQDEDDSDDQTQGNQPSDNSQPNWQPQQQNESAWNASREHRGYFPIETIAFMTKLEDLELYLYEPIVGLTIHNWTQVPLPVSKTLTRLVLSCRYCQQINLQELGQWLPNLRHLTIAAPLNPNVLTEQSLKSWSKLEELVIYDGDIKSVKAQAFRSLPALKNLSIKYAPLNSEWNREQWQQVEDTLESLSIVGTPLKQIDVSTFGRLNRLDVSDNEITNFERGVFPQKAQFTELNISYNPVKQVQNGFLHGVEVSNHVLHLNGWEIESFDWNAVEGMQNLRVVDVTKNPKLTKLQVTDHKKLPTQLHRIVVGRSPNLKLDDEKGQIAQTIRERNITLVVEGQVACTCKMNWIHQIQQENPEWIEINRSRAICSRQGTDAGSIPTSFWKNPTVANFLKHINDDKTGWCKNKKP